MAVCVHSKQAGVLGEALFILLKSWHGQLEQALTANVDPGENNGEHEDESAD